MTAAVVFALETLVYFAMSDEGAGYKIVTTLAWLLLLGSMLVLTWLPGMRRPMRIAGWLLAIALMTFALPAALSLLSDPHIDRKTLTQFTDFAILAVIGSLVFLVLVTVADRLFTRVRFGPAPAAQDSYADPSPLSSG